MRPVAARLVLLSNPSAYRRLAGIVGVVGLGMGMLFILLGTYLHMPERDGRVAWQYSTGVAEGRDYTDTGLVPIAPSDDTILLSTRIDFFTNSTIEVAQVASTPGTTVAFPAGIVPPRPGEYYASPAMARLIDATPHDQLGARYGTRIGILPAEMLKGPSERVVFMGMNWDLLSANDSAMAQHRFGVEGDRSPSFRYRTILAIGSVAILVPIVLLISIVSQLGAVERRERLATVRLIGAGRRGIAALAGIEMGLATLVGGIVGIGFAALIRPAAALLTIDRTTSYAGDLVPSLGWTALCIVVVTVLGAVAAWWRTYRDDVGALGATRERPEKPTTAWRTASLVAGLALLAGSVLLSRTGSGIESFLLLGIVVGFGLTAFGVVIAGSWVTRVTSKTYGKLARSASGVVAAGRLARHPRATFRSVAGVVVAVYVVSVFAGLVSSVTGQTGLRDTPGLLVSSAVLATADNPEQADAMAAAARTVPGVDRVVIAYYAANPNDGRDVMTAAEARAIGAIDVPEAPVVQVDLYAMLAGGFGGPGTPVPTPQPARTIEGLTPDFVIAVTDGNPTSIERVRTAMIAAGQPNQYPTTRADYIGIGSLEVTQELSVLAYLGMAIAIGVSALALAVATVAAALDRKRTFGLLRLAGMPVSELRRSVMTEAALPLGTTLVASAGLGFFVDWVLVHALGDRIAVTWPDVRYWWAMLGSLAIAALAVAGSFGVVRRSTEVESTRFE